MARAQVLHEVLEREARVEDVLDDQDVATLDLGVEVLDDAHDARGDGAVAITRDGHEVDAERAVDGAHHVSHEDDGTAKNRDEQRVLAGIVLRDLCAHTRDDALDVLLGQDDLADVRMNLLHGAILFPFWGASPVTTGAARQAHSVEIRF